MGAENPAKVGTWIHPSSRVDRGGLRNLSRLRLGPAAKRMHLLDGIRKSGRNMNGLAAAYFLRGLSEIVGIAPDADHEPKLRVSGAKIPIEPVRPGHSERRQAGKKHHVRILSRHDSQD